jgi:hypothetical protein
MTLWPSNGTRTNAANALAAPPPVARLKHGLNAFTAVSGHGLAVQHRRCDGPPDLAQPGESGEMELCLRLQRGAGLRRDGLGAGALGRGVRALMSTTRCASSGAGGS